MKLRSVAMTGVLSLAGLGLIGAGAHATFTTQTTSQQTIGAGKLAVVLTASGSSGCTSLSDNCTSLTFPALGLVGSSFTTTDQVVTMTNVGTIPATEITFNLTATPPSSVLANEASMCVTSTGLGTNGNDYVLYNGPLSGGLNANWGQNGDTLTVGGSYTNTAAPTDNYIINIYAGTATTQCGSTFTANDVISNEGTLANASTGATGTPGPSAAPTLQNGAEGGSVTLTATTTYQG
jgi:hypothetical protein